MLGLRLLVVTVAMSAISYEVEGFNQQACNYILQGLNSLYYCKTANDKDLTVNFHLHNEYSPKEQKIACNGNYCSYHFDPQQPTAIIIHGYLSGRDAAWIPPMIKKLREWHQNKINVITVEWCKHFDYLRSAQAVDQVAQQVARMVQYRLFKQNQPKKKHIHIIGHSLGAHIAGLTAKRLKYTNWPVNRVTGLDPAKPFFDQPENAHLRLNKDVALFVDVIHTNSYSDNSETLGLFQRMGHLDFYPNGGIDQPNCNRAGKLFGSDCFNGTTLSLPGIGALGLNIKIGFLGGIFGPNHVCDHGTAPEFFTRSLDRRERFFATRVQKPAELNGLAEGCPEGRDCINDPNCAEMGINAEAYLRWGSF